MNSMTKPRIIRLLEESKDRINSITYMLLPRALEARAMIIERKLIDLLEDVRDLQTD